MQKDMLQEIQDNVRRKEIDKNFKESDINNLKPEIKQLQSEKGSKLRCASLFMRDLLSALFACILNIHIHVYRAGSSKVTFVGLYFYHYK